MQVQVLFVLALLDIPDVPLGLSDIERFESSHFFQGPFRCWPTSHTFTHGGEEEVAAEGVATLIEARALHIVRLIQLEFVCEKYWVDLVDNLLGLRHGCLNRLFISGTHAGEHVFSPHLHEDLQNVNIVDELGEAREDYTATWLLEIPQCTLFQETLPCVVAIPADEQEKFLLDQAR